MTISIQKLSKENKLDWDKYVENKHSSIYHDSRWPLLIKKVFGHTSHHLLAIENEEVIGILPLVQIKSILFGNYLVSMPYFNYGGVLVDSEVALNELHSAANQLSTELGCSHIEYRLNCPLNTRLPVKENKVTMILELPDDPDVLWKAIGSKRRSQVNRPVREGVEFHTGGLELLDEFYSVFAINMRDLGTPVYSKTFFQEILKTFSAETFLVVVRLNGEPVAAAFLIGHAGVLEIPWASTLRKVNRIGVNMYLYWHTLKTAIEKGFRQFDFGRSSKDAGTLKFKKQWGGQQKQLYWYYDLPENQDLPGLNPDNKKFQMAISIWQKLPIPLTRLIGPTIVKNLP